MHGLCVALILATSCSIDEAKLRTPGGKGRDAASEPLAPVEVAQGGGDGESGREDLGGGADITPRVDLGAVVDAPAAGDGPGPSDVVDSLEAGEIAVAPETGSGAGGGGGAGGAGDANATGGAGGTSLGEGGVTYDGDTATGGAVDADGDAIGGTSVDTNPGEDATDAATEPGDGATGDESDGLEPDAVVDAEESGDGGLETGADDVGTPVLDPDLVLWYRFDESSGTAAADSAQFGGIARNATLATIGTGSSATFTAAAQVGSHALSLSPATGLSGGGGYVILPTLNTLAPQAVTFAVWVNLASVSTTQNWERIFDYGDSTTAPTWFNLAARGGSSPYGPMFNMSDSGHGTADQQKISGSTALPANTWHHLAVVLPAGVPYTGVLYVDGAIAGTNNAMTVHLADIGANLNAWIGRSQFTNDPYFYGSLDDFRVYRRALSQQEIVDLLSVR